MRIFAAILFIFMLTAAAYAGAATVPALPEGAEVVDETAVGPYVLATVEFPTGEQALLTTEAETGAPVSLVTTYAPEAPDLGAQDRQQAETAVMAQYPDALILFGEDGEDGGKILYVISPDVCGEIAVRSGMICRRSLEYGDFMADGRLTMDGALAAMSLHRSEARFRALELDEDDGVWCYDGEAYVDGVEYEFELNAVTGKLLEWERD